MLDEAVEDREARGAVRRPSKDVAAKNEGADGKAAVAQRAFGHGVSPCFTAGTAPWGLSLTNPTIPALIQTPLPQTILPTFSGLHPDLPPPALSTFSTPKLHAQHSLPDHDAVR